MHQWEHRSTTPRHPQDDPKTATGDTPLPVQRAPSEETLGKSFKKKNVQRNIIKIQKRKTNQSINKILKYGKINR